jgi:hypothetical protein
MNKEFVPYELAVKLKNLGFDEPCIMQWHYTNDLLFCVDVRNYPKYKTNLESKSDSLGDCISAPTFSQAFRWFRDKYELYSTIMFRVSMEDNNEYWDWLIKGEEVVYRHFKTYEEAELACLTKLIEIVEQQNQK